MSDAFSEPSSPMLIPLEDDDEIKYDGDNRLMVQPPPPRRVRLAGDAEEAKYKELHALRKSSNPFDTFNVHVPSPIEANSNTAGDMKFPSLPPQFATSRSSPDAAGLDDELDLLHSPGFGRSATSPGPGGRSFRHSKSLSHFGGSFIRRATISPGPPQHVSRSSGYSVATELLESEEEVALAAENQANEEVVQPAIWQDISESPGRPGSMSGQTMVCFGRSAYIFGGYDEGQALADCFSFDLDTLVWTKLDVCGDVPDPRTSHSAAVDHTKGKMYILCGSGSAFGHTNLGDIYCLDLRLRMWSKMNLTGDEITPRYGQSTVLFHDKLYLFGGTFGREFSQEMFMIDLTKGRCTKVNCSGNFPSPRYKHSACVVAKSNEMVVFAGAERLNYRLSDVFLFNFISHRWTSIRCSGEAPSGRFAHTMSISSDGSKAYVFGGTDRVNCFNDLYEFELETKVWRRIAVGGNSVPRSRYFHSACLDSDTGYMYIWGGKGSTSLQIRYADMYRIQVEKPEQYKNQEQCTLVGDLTEMLWNEDLTDVEVECEQGILVRAHEVILKARLGSSCSDLFFISHKLPSRIVEMVLYFIYSDNLIISRTIPPLDYLVVFIAAKKLRLFRLAQLCFKRIQEIISRKFSIELLDGIKALGCENQLPVLEKYLLLFTNLHFGQGKVTDAHTASEEFAIQLPASSISSDLLKLRKPLRFIAASPRGASCSPTRLAGSISPQAKKRPVVHSSSSSIYLPPCDMTFHFGLQDPSLIEIKAHSMILAARSRYFASPSFRDIMIEAQDKTCVFPGMEDEIDGTLSPSAFSFFLDYLYGGRSVLQNLSLDFAKEFVRADVCNYFSLSSNELVEASLELLAARASGRALPSNRATIGSSPRSPMRVSGLDSPNGQNCLIM
jgi:hypothetical protein